MELDKRKAFDNVVAAVNQVRSFDMASAMVVKESLEFLARELELVPVPPKSLDDEVKDTESSE